MALLEVRDLSVAFGPLERPLRAVEHVDLSVDRGEVLGIVGESGSGKSVAMLAVMGLIGHPGRVQADSIRFDDVELPGLTPGQRRAITGRDVAMVFQEPMTSLNPCFSVGFQIMETLKTHTDADRAERRARAIELLEQVGIPEPEARLSAFPHQLSGGMCQRVMIAMAISCNPRLLIADEPTTALDVTIQAQILDLLLELQRQRGMALILITHDMGVVAESAHRVAVMYAGQVVETRHAADLFAGPRHPYTSALLEALPERSAARRRLPTIPGVVPGQYDRPEGCLFHPRCGRADARCGAEPPSLIADGDGGVRCHHPLGHHPLGAEVGAT